MTHWTLTLITFFEMRIVFLSRISVLIDASSKLTVDWFIQWFIFSHRIFWVTRSLSRFLSIYFAHFLRKFVISVKKKIAILDFSFAQHFALELWNLNVSPLCGFWLCFRFDFPLEFTFLLAQSRNWICINLEFYSTKIGWFIFLTHF